MIEEIFITSPDIPDKGRIKFIYEGKAIIAVEIHFNDMIDFIEKDWKETIMNTWEERFKPSCSDVRWCVSYFYSSIVLIGEQNTSKFIEEIISTIISREEMNLHQKMCKCLII